MTGDIEKTTQVEREFLKMGQLCDVLPDHDSGEWRICAASMPKIVKSFVQVALEEARSRRRGKPFKDGDTICFVRLNQYVPAVSSDFETQVRYWDMRLNGESHSVAEILATRTFPGVRTDSTFNIDTENGKQFEKTPALGDQFRREAEAAGVSTTGKVYKHGLANFPGDPTAWVSGRGDVERVCKEKGFNCSGAVDYRAEEREPTPDVEIADDMVESEVNEIMELNPGVRREDVREQVVEVRTGKVDNNPLRLTNSGGLEF